MSIEQALQDLTKAVEANTAAILGGKAAKTETTAAAPKAAKAEKAAAKEPAAEEINYETEVKPRVLALVKAKGREVMDSILTPFAVKSAKELKPEQYADFLASLTEHEGEDDVA